MGILTSPALRYPKSLSSYNPCPTGCVLYLPLWHSSLGVSTFKSIDPFGHTCTVSGTATTWLPPGWHFAGDDEKITVPDHAALDIAINLTIAMWIKADTINFPEDDTLVQKGGRGGAGSEYCFYTDAEDDIYFGAAFDDGGYAWASHEIITNIVQDTWTHIAVTYDGANIRGYKDGSAGTPQAQVGNMKTSTNDVSIMGLNGFLDAYCGEVWICNRVLPATEIAYLCAVTKGRYA